MNDSVLKSACRLINDGKLDEAIEILKRDLKIRPWNHDLRLYLGISYFLKNEREIAFKELEKIEKELKKMEGSARSFGDQSMFLSMGIERKDRGVFSPENKGLFNFCYGIILKEKGEFKEAEKKLKEALKERYNEIKVRLQLIDLAIKERKFDKAKKELDSILKLVEEDEIILFIKGYIYSRTGKLDEAIGCYEKILSLNPDCILAKKNLGIILYNKGDYEEALNIFSEIIEKYPEEKDVMINMGRVYFHLGDKEKAQEFFDKAGIKIPVERYSPKKIPLLPPQLDKKIELELTCK